MKSKEKLQKSSSVIVIFTKGKTKTSQTSLKSFFDCNLKSHVVWKQNLVDVVPLISDKRKTERQNNDSPLGQHVEE